MAPGCFDHWATWAVCGTGSDRQITLDSLPALIAMVLLYFRSIVWLQNKRDAALERLRGPSPRREDAHEFRVGRLKHERVCVPRDDSLLEWAMQVMKYHGDRKAVLEVLFSLLSASVITTEAAVHL